MASALQTRIFLPSYYTTGAAATLTNVTVNANNAGIGFVFDTGSSEAITDVEFRVNSVLGTVTNLCIVTLETVDTSTGKPTGTDVGSTATTVTVAGTAVMQKVTLANSYTPTGTETLALTLRGQTGLDGSNNFVITRNDAAGNGIYARPYGLSLAAGTWGTPAAATPIGFNIITANTRTGIPYEATLATRSSTTVGNRNAAYFTVPSTWCSTYKVAGLRGMFSIAGAAAKAPLMGIWNAAGTVQGATRALDSDVLTSSTASLNDCTFYFTPAQRVALTAGTEYYVGFESADAANGGSIIRAIQLHEDNDKLAYAGGTNIGAATWNGAAWTKDTTTFGRPHFELILDDITAPSGGSGGGMVRILT